MHLPIQEISHETTLSDVLDSRIVVVLSVPDLIPAVTETVPPIIISANAEIQASNHCILLVHDNHLFMVRPQQVAVESTPVPHYEDVLVFQLHLCELRVVWKHRLMKQHHIDTNSSICCMLQDRGDLPVRKSSWKCSTISDELYVRAEEETHHEDLMLCHEEGLGNSLTDSLTIDEIPRKAATQDVPITFLGSTRKAQRCKGAKSLMLRSGGKLCSDSDGITPVLSTGLPPVSLVTEGQLQDPRSTPHQHMILLISEKRKACVEEEHISGEVVHNRAEECNTIFSQDQPSLLTATFTFQWADLKSAIALHAENRTLLPSSLTEKLL
mmetsp:Transcript_78500/g.138244  ORF Transcript_78500/g.138244 Transcript_78500/m.138244 type:complete len:326 (+) Transcript_78500:1303-2280(+)